MPVAVFNGCADEEGAGRGAVGQSLAQTAAVGFCSAAVLHFSVQNAGRLSACGEAAVTIGRLWELSHSMTHSHPGWMLGDWQLTGGFFRGLFCSHLWWM